MIDMNSMTLQAAKSQAQASLVWEVVLESSEKIEGHLCKSSSVRQGTFQGV
jgi:hypothetical protein